MLFASSTSSRPTRKCSLPTARRMTSTSRTPRAGGTTRIASRADGRRSASDSTMARCTRPATTSNQNTDAHRRGHVSSAFTGRPWGDPRWSGRQDLNLRPLAPQASALAKLRHAPMEGAEVIEGTRGRRQLRGSGRGPAPGGMPRASAECGGMARPARTLWITRGYARRRHRSWHLAMMLATLGWGTWWCVLFVRHLAPEREIPFVLPATISTAAALLGLLIAILTLRARRAWILFALVPLFANGSLLLVPCWRESSASTDSEPSGWRQPALRHEASATPVDSSEPFARVHRLASSA